MRRNAGLSVVPAKLLDGFEINGIWVKFAVDNENIWAYASNGKRDSWASIPVRYAFYRQFGTDDCVALAKRVIAEMSQ